MKIAMIAAKTQNNVIGKDNDLPWHLPDDMKFFMQKTTGHHVIMGRKNFESLPPKFSPLPNRTNIIMTRKTDYHPEGTEVVHSLEDALAVAERGGEQEVFIIGGGEIYKLGLDRADILYLTEIKTEMDGDAYFPEIDLDKWKETARTPHTTDDRHKYAFDFVTYVRI